MVHWTGLERAFVYIHTRSNQPVYLYARVYTLSLKCEMMYLRRQLPSPSFPTRFAPLVQARGPSSPSSSSFRLIIGLRAKSITLPSPIFLARMNGGLSVSQSPLKHILSQNSFHQVSFPSFTNERKWAFQIIPSISLYVRSKYACNFVIFENMIGRMVVVCLFQLLNEFWKFISEIRVAIHDLRNAEDRRPMQLFGCCASG